MSCDILCSFLKGNLDIIRLFHASFDQLVWHAISTQRSSASVPVELGCRLSLDKVWYCQILSLCYAWILIASTRPCWAIKPQQKAILILTCTLVGKRISHWNIIEGDKNCWKCCRVSNKINYESRLHLFHLMCCSQRHYHHSALLAILGKEIGKPRKEIGNLNGFEYHLVWAKLKLLLAVLF